MSVFVDNVCKKTRTIYLGGEVNAEMSEEVIKGLYSLAMLNKKPIKILINSEGGDVYEAFAIYDAIRASGCVITGYVLGCCMSAATLILQGCDRRFLSPNARFMLHEGTTGVGRNKPSETLSQAREGKFICEKVDEVIAERSGQSLSAIRRLSAKTTYLSAAEAVANGFADAVADQPRLSKKGKR